MDRGRTRAKGSHPSGTQFPKMSAPPTVEGQKLRRERDYDGTGFVGSPETHVTLSVTIVISLGLPKGNGKFGKDQYAQS